MPEMRYCSKCHKTMAEVNYYTYKDGSKCELCKSCLTMHINNFEPDTYLWILEKFDIPYLPWEWDNIRDKAYQKDPYKMNGMSVFGKYLSKMKLKQYIDPLTKKTYTWADTERLQEEHNKLAIMYGQPEEVAAAQLAEMEKAYKNGEITESQWMTYKQINAPKPDFQMIDGAVTTTMGGEQASAYPVNDHPFEQVDLPTVELTPEEKITFATKWGRFYSIDDWLYLESKYKDFMKSFDIQGAARIDTLIQICKLSLKANQALDSGDYDNYAKLNRSYDLLMKSAKFTEAQRKEEKSGDFDSVGQIVYFAEKEKGKISRYKIDTPLDLADKAIENLKRYNKDLILNDPSLAQQLENYIKRRENFEDMKRNQAEAEANGLERVEIKDKDYSDFNKLLNEDNEEEE